MLIDTWVVFIFWLLWIMLLWTLLYKYLFDSLLWILWGYVSRSGIAGSYGNSILNFLRNLHTVFHSGYTVLYFHQQCTRFPVSLHPWQYLLFPGFLTIAIPVGMKWYLIVVLIHISLMTNDGRHLFMCWLAICISPLEECLFKSFHKSAFWYGWVIKVRIILLLLTWIYTLMSFILWFYSLEESE